MASQTVDVFEMERKEEANRQKELGNKLLAENKTQEAVEAYTRAIECDPESHIMYSNRSAAYYKLGDGEKALADADKCVELNPKFAKGFGRRAGALLLLKRYQECLEACDAGFKLEKINSVLAETQRSAKKGLVCEKLKGSWVGTVHDAIGGYEQVFEFVSDSELKVTVMGRALNAMYNIDVDKNPQHMNIAMPPEPGMMPPGMPPPEVPYIFKLVTPEGQQEGSGQEELHICCPYMSAYRPRKFEGPGLCCMRRAVASDMAMGVRVVSEEIGKLSREEQLVRFCSEMQKMMPDTPMDEPLPSDSQEVTAAKMAKVFRLQNEMMKLDMSYPEEISLSVQAYVEGSKPVEEGQSVYGSVKRLAIKMRTVGFAPPDSVQGPKTKAEFIQSLLGNSAGSGSASSAAPKKEESKKEDKREEAKQSAKAEQSQQSQQSEVQAKPRAVPQDKAGSNWMLWAGAAVVVGVATVAAIRYVSSKKN